jgi:hypothetical protein
MVYPLPWSAAPHGHGAPEVKAFLYHLTNERDVSVSTHKQALCALLFLYKQVLESDFPLTRRHLEREGFVFRYPSLALALQSLK